MTPARNDDANTKTESGENPTLSILASSFPDVNADEDRVGDVGAPAKADTDEQTSEKTTSKFFASLTTNLALDATTARKRPFGDQQDKVPEMSKDPSKFILPKYCELFYT